MTTTTERPAGEAERPATQAPSPDSTDAGGGAALSAQECDRRIDVLRTQIDAVDDAIIALIDQRVALSKNVGALRRADGGPRLSLSRENQIIAKFARALGGSGTPLAMLLLKISRGRM